MNNVSDSTENLQQQNLQRQMAVMQKLMQQFETLPAKIDALTKNAAHDPVARARLEKLEQAWHNGLSQDVKKMQTSAKKALDLAVTYRTNLLGLVADKSAPMTAMPRQPVKRRRSRQFA